jgi:hypothetical protein
MTPVAKTLPGKIGRIGMETLGRAVAGGSAAYQGVDALNRLKRGDYAGAALGGLGAIGSGAALIPTPATRVVGTALGTLGGLGTMALDEYRKRKEPKMADGGPVQHYFGGGTVSLAGIQNLSTPIQTTTMMAAPNMALDMAATPSMAPDTTVAPSMTSGMAVAPTIAPTAFSENADLTNRMTATNFDAGNPMMATNVGAGNPMMQDNPMTTTNVGVGNPNVMPKIRQFSPQRTPFIPRRTQNSGMPAYMQNNQAYEAQRQSRGPFTTFPPVNQLLPQGRVTPRRGIPVARMAEGGSALPKISLDTRNIPDMTGQPGVGYMETPQGAMARLQMEKEFKKARLRAGVSGAAMAIPGQHGVKLMPGQMDVGANMAVGPGELDVSANRSINPIPGKGYEQGLNARYTVRFAKGGKVKKK